jgi:Micrococcal nuclease (thermonuclease) homologs
MNPVRRTWWLYCFLAILAAPLLAAEYTGKVVSISDGDTLTLLVPDGASYQQVKIRLGEIDTPESKQPYGSRARQALSDLAFGKQARVVVQDTDRYGRKVSRVYVGGIDVNAEMVKQGAAWVYRKYAQDQALYRLEEQAKAAKRGLWGLPEAQRCPPWDWRKNACPTSAATPATSASLTG